jgi:ABC-type transport system substrate-binding protein
MTRFRAIVAGLTVGLGLSGAGPAAAENVLRWGNADDAKTADPHSYSDIESDSVMQQIYDTLVALDSDMNVADHLAVPWKPANPTTWGFELRRVSGSMMVRHSQRRMSSSVFAVPRPTPRTSRII